jgi:glycerol-3-phosphate dehydrogenase (NAD(P)+)
MNSVCVLGAGSYGTALAFCLSRNGVETVLWGRDKQQIELMANDRCNQKYLPDALFPKQLSLESDLQRAILSSQDILVVVPSHAFSDTLQQAISSINLYILGAFFYGKYR